MASEYTYILPTDSLTTIKRKKAIASMEGQKKAAIELKLWTDDQEKQLQTLKDELDTGQILPTLPDTKDEGESFTGTGNPNAVNVVLGLLKNHTTNKAIKMATGYGIPVAVINFALCTPIGQGAAQDFNQMRSDLGGTITGTAKNLGNVIKSAFSPNETQSSVANQGIMAAGQQALRQTPSQIAAQQAASQATQQGNYQAPIMSQQEMVREAQQTGGTVNPHEATKAVYRPSLEESIDYRRRGKAEGGMVYDPNERREMNPLALGLAGYSAQNTHPLIQNGGGRQKPPQGGWNQLPQGPPRDIFGIQGMGEQIGGFGETLGGYGEQMGGFGEQLGGFGEQLGGFKGQFENIDSRLQNMEQGITSLTDKLGVQQQPQNPFQMYGGFGGYNPYSSGYGGYSFFKDGGEVENTPSVEDRQNEIIKHLKDKGYSNAAISGILGNIDVETGGTFNHEEKEDKLKFGDELGDGYGLFQFSGSMKKNYNKWIKDNNIEDSIESQIDFMDEIVRGKSDHKLHSKKAAMLKGVLFSDKFDAPSIAEGFNTFFEGGKHSDRRKESASSFFTTFDAEQELSPPTDSQEGGITNVLESLRPRMAGGGIMDYTQGGHAVGPGTGTSDSIPAFLSDGEFVMTADAVKGIGGGNRQQGAQKLYSMMKKAEAGA